MPSEKALFLLENYITTAVLTGGNWEPSLPLENLKDPQPSESPARTTGLGPEDGVIVADFPRPRPVNYVAFKQPIPKPFITQSASWRVQLDKASGDFSAPLFDSGEIPMWPSVVPFGVGEWGGFQWGGKLSEDEASRYNLDTALSLTAGVVASRMKVTLSDSSSPMGYVGGGTLLAGSAVRPSRNIDADWRIVSENQDRFERAKSGTLHADVSGTHREIEVRLSLSKEDEALGVFFDRFGVFRSGPILISVNPANQLHAHRMTVWGMVTRPVEFSAKPGFPGRYTFRIIVEEMP